MKKLWLLIIWLLTLLFAWNFSFAYNGYEYTNLDITADVLIDWTMNVNEDFTADFFDEKHGIIRTIPLNYSVEGNDFHINISGVKVKWKKFRTNKTDQEQEIKIWDANKVVKWRQTYPIFYKVYGLIRNFSGMWYAELYWNLVWYDFDTNINKVHAVINLPKSYTWFTDDDFLITTDWETSSVKEFKWTVDWSNGDKIIISYDEPLPAFQWITLAIKFPNNYFEFNHRKQKRLIWKYSENIINVIYKKYLWLRWMILLLWFLICTGLDIHKNAQQRKIKEKYPVIIQYSAPKGMSPSEVWLLYNRCAKPSQIVSLIYKWAAEWYISFEKKWLRTTIIKNKELNSAKKSETADSKGKKYEIIETNFENDTRRALFHGKEKVSLPSEEFNLQLLDLEDDLYSACLKKNRFEKSWHYNSLTSNQNFSDTYLWKFAITTAILLFVSFIRENEQLLLSSFWMWSVATLLTLPIKKRLTDKWYELLAHIKWYKEFIKTCDTNRMRLLLKENPLFFDRTLPYAVALGLWTDFMKNFKPIAKEMWINSSYCDVGIARALDHQIFNYSPESSWWGWSSSGSSYSSSWWFSSGSSFSGWWFSSGWGWGWWGWRSW